MSWPLRGAPQSLNILNEKAPSTVLFLLHRLYGIIKDTDTQQVSDKQVTN